MYAYLRGVVAEKGGRELVLDVGGVGYLLSCSATTLSDIPPKGEEALVYTHLIVREDALELLGFATREERAMFERLNSVSGVGAKTALGILGSMPLKDLTLAILTGDAVTLSRAPGVGKKTAQRIALELKELVEMEDFSLSGDAPAPSGGGEDAEKEAILALQTLGYSASEAARAVSRVRESAQTADEMVRQSLRGMTKG